MKIVKSITTRINIASNEIYSADIDKMILEKLKSRFTNRCFHSMYITNILKCTDRGLIQTQTKNLSGNYYVDVAFDAEGVVYEYGEIITGCEILSIDENGIITATTENTNLLIHNEYGKDIFSKGDVESFIIDSASYSMPDPFIATRGTPLVPSKNEVIYMIKSEKEEKIDLHRFTERVKELKARLAKVDAKVLKMFDTLLYPYKKIKSYKYKKVCIKELDSIKVGTYIFVPARTHSEDHVYIVTEKDLEQQKIVETDNISVIELIYSEYVKQLTNYLTLCETYHSFELIKQKEHIWKACLAMKVNE